MSKKKGTRIADNPSITNLQRNVHGAKQLMKLRPLLKLFGVRIEDSVVAQLEELDQSLQKFATLPDRFNDLLSERGWIAYEMLKTEVMQRAVDLGEAGNVESAEQLLVEHFDEETINWGIKFMWAVKAFRPRERLARLALEDYLHERYHACVPVLLMIIDGLVNDVHGSKGFFADGIDLTAWDSIAAHDRGLQALGELWRKGRKKTTTEAITLPYRHGILHGRDLGYDNRPVAAKLWAALFALREWALAVQNNRVEEPPPEPKPTLWESLEQYRRVREEGAELETWRPRTKEKLTAIPRTGEPEVYEAGSPERAVAELMHLWFRKNYGHMAQLIHLPFEGPFDSRKAGPIAKELRELLAGKQLQAFRFLEVQDQAAAITTAKLAIDYEENGDVVAKDLNLHLIYADEHGPALRGKPGGAWTIQDLWSAIY